jgi:uncharacterized sodium:solute symporter family permease YidK
MEDTGRTYFVPPSNGQYPIPLLALLVIQLDFSKSLTALILHIIMHHNILSYSSHLIQNFQIPLPATRLQTSPLQDSL